MQDPLCYLVGYRRDWQRAKDLDQVKPATAGRKLVSCRGSWSIVTSRAFTQPELAPERIGAYLKSTEVRARRRMPDYLQEGKVAALLQAAGSAMDRAMLALAIGLGLRVMALCDLLMSDARPLGEGCGILEVRQVKGRDSRAFRIGPEASGPARDYAEIAGRTRRTVETLTASS